MLLDALTLPPPNGIEIRVPAQRRRTKHRPPFTRCGMKSARSPPPGVPGYEAGALADQLLHARRAVALLLRLHGCRHRVTAQSRATGDVVVRYAQRSLRIF